MWLFLAHCSIGSWACYLTSQPPLLDLNLFINRMGGAGKEVPVLLGAAQEMYTVHFILTIELGLAIIALKSMPAYDLLICLLP